MAKYILLFACLVSLKSTAQTCSASYVKTIQEQIFVNCPCDGFSDERKAYIRCAGSVVNELSISKACRQDIMTAARKSTCGRPESAVVCCSLNTLTDVQSCSIKATANRCRSQGNVLRKIASGVSCADSCQNIFDNSNEPVPPQPPGPAPEGNCSGTYTSGSVSMSAIEIEFFNLVNQYRKNNGAPPLCPCKRLAKESRSYAEHMSRQYYKPNPNPWLPHSPDSQEGRVAEIIAAGRSRYTAQAMFEGFKASPSHNSIMLYHPLRYMGVGYARKNDSQYTNYWTAQMHFDSSACNP